MSTPVHKNGKRNVRASLVGMRGVEPPPSNLDLALNQARLPFRHIPERNIFYTLIAEVSI